VNNNLYATNIIKWIPKQKQSKFSSLSILSGCTAYLNFCLGRIYLRKGLGLGNWPRVWPWPRGSINPWPCVDEALALKFWSWRAFKQICKPIGDDNKPLRLLA